MLGAQKSKPASRRVSFVAGAGFDLLTTCNRSESRSDSPSNTRLDAVDLAFLDYLVEKAIETFSPPPPAALSMIDSLESSDRRTTSRRKRRRR